MDIISAAVPRAVDLINLLESHIILLPGGRDLTGHPILTFPNIGICREKLGRDEYKKVLHYLSSITRYNILSTFEFLSKFPLSSPESQEAGFTVIIDTRGSSYNAIKPILKTLEEGKIPTLKIHHVYLTKPDTFWQKQRALLAKGKYRFEVVHLIL